MSWLLLLAPVAGVWGQQCELEELLTADLVSTLSWEFSQAENSGVTQGSLGGSCADLNPLWSGDSVAPMARCTAVLDGAFDQDPTFEVTEVDVCLARASGQDGTYFLFQGGIWADGAYASHYQELYLLASTGAGSDDEIHEGAGQLAIEDHSHGLGVGDLWGQRQDLIYDELDGTLLFRQSSKEDWFSLGWDTAFSVQLSCAGL